ncbi:Chromodomain-helicase-dna-binding protein [Thalictrum thalictroides]|uniref:Chromodomain-helicase-dna-binding protein n=1 Tax=Thalictrum thalictroides TaxID=46969 RepID=A0A7J6VDT3_THATH|nr:Chromodomain-helicase-dna-binding protein [Thalictrum thalictroides]
MANVTRSTRKFKEDDTNSKGGNVGGKGLSASGSSNSDTSGLRRSARETPVKKQRASSPVSTRKSERIEKRTPLSPPTMRKSEIVEKQRMPSPLRRSERGGNHLSTSSPDSRKSEKGLDLLENRNKQENTDNSEKFTKVNTIDRSRDEKKDTRTAHTVSRKKRMDARTYIKALLKPQPKKTQESDRSKRLKEHDEASQGDTVRMGSSSFKEAVAEDIVRNAEEVGEKDAGEGEDRDAEESCDGLKNLEARRSKNIGEELAHSSRKRKKFEDEFHECTNRDSSPVSKCSSLELFPGVSAKEAVTDAEKVQLDGSTRDGILKVSMVSTSEGRSVSDDQCLEKDFTLGTPKKKKKLDEIDSDASMTAANEEIYSSADPVPSSPSESKRASFLERCYACSKRQRFEVDSQKCLICSHNNEENRNSCNDSSLEEVREKGSIFKNPDNGLMPTHCTIKDGNQTKVNHIDRSLREDVHRSEPLSDVERKNVHGQTFVHSTGRISNPLEEEGGELMFTSCKGLSEECCNKMQSKESPLDIQTEYDHNACVICKLGGELLCCNGKGCKRNYHLHCLDLPLKIVPVGVWHCFQCIKRKIQFGMHSVSEGVESICDVREEVVPDCEGSRKQKHYLVKYKGLAHVHNRWVPEHQLLLEFPLLVARFKKKQTLKWKSKWTKPHRLVQKRFLTSPKQQDETFSDCQCEWFVKWTSLGYEHGTWELENAPFLGSIEAMELKRDYESRLEKAVSAANPSFVKLLEERKNTAPKQSKLPSLDTCRLDTGHLNFVNKLREYWRKSQNAVVAEDQEHILKVVLFILSMHSDVCRPFLIISTSHAISLWEAEFMRSAPSVNVVAYNGNKVVRETIRALEFYEDGGCVMLQVLLSPIEAIIEDLEAFEFIGWEAIIVDECQRPRVSCHYEQIKKLTNGFRLLLLSGPIKDSIAEYLNHLSFIETGDISMKTDSGDTISNLKERFARFVVCDRKSDSSKFVEYWVPVRLSNVQLEQYCATLLSNSFSLCSCSKNDPVGALRDILISVRKTCDHPYLVNQSLQSLLRKDLSEVESLDVEINASGKLQVLDKILSEIKERGLRVLILFQSIGGSGRNGIGDILDDFLCQRFGQESYERVDSGLLSSRKQAALNKFNNKERGRFVFLIENRACVPSIKLSSVDMLIIFDSDWNPLNDLRALQKISIDSQFEQLKVFRLYSSCSVEEKVLILAKQNLTLDSNIQNLNNSTSHLLLLWGANFLFHKLDEFHSDCTSSSVSKISSEQLFLSDLMQEVLSQLPNDAESKEKENCKIVIKAQQSGASYSNDIKLLGEKEMQLMGEELPHVLWTNILKGRYPQWRYASGPSQRIRRKVQYYDELPEKPQENAEIVKKRKKVVSNIVDLNSLESGLNDKRKLVSVDKEGASGGPTGNGSPILFESTAKTNTVNHSVLDKPEIHAVDSEENNNLRESQKSLHLSLKPVISKLCEILQLPDDVKSMAGKFLEYMMNNHKVYMEPISLFQAFQISLCWSAASLLNCKIGRKFRKESLSLAKQHLNFECKEEEAQSVYSVVLQGLKKQFCHQVDSVELIPAENHSPKGKEEKFDPMALQSSLSGQQELEDGEIRETPKSHKCSIQLDSSQEKQAADSENGSGSSNFGSSKNIKQVNKVHRWRMKKLYEKQEVEFEKFKKNKEKIVEKEHAHLEKKHKLESALIRRLNSQLSVRLGKLKKLDQDFARKKEEVNIRMEEQQKRLVAMQRIARDEEYLLEKQWMQEAKSGRSVATYATLPLSVFGSRVDIMEDLEQVIVSHESSSSGFRVEHMNGCVQGGVIREEATTPSSMSLERQDTNGVVSVLPAGAVPSVICVTIPEKEFEVIATEPSPLSMQFSEAVVEKNTLVSESAADTKSKQEGRLCRSGSGSSSLEQMLIIPLSDQGHTAPAQDGQIRSFQVTVDENAEPAEPDLYDVEVSKYNVSNESQVDIQALWAADAVACNQVNGDTPVVLSDVQLQLSQADSLPNGLTQSDVQACARVHQEPNVLLQQFDAQIQEPCEDQDAMVDVEVSESNVSNESQVGIQVLRAADAVLCNAVNDDTTMVPFAVQLQLSPVADTLSNEPSQSDVQACARVDREPNVSLQPFEAQIGAPCEDQDAMVDVEVSESNVSNESQVGIQVLQAADAVLCNAVNDDTTIVPSAVQLQLSPVADTLSNEPSQSDVQAYVRVDREPNVSLQPFEAQIRAPCEDHDAMIDEEVFECNVVNESQVEIRALLEVDAVSSNQVIDDTLVVPSAVQLQLSPGADTLSTEPTQSDVQACARVDQEPNVSLQQFETQRRAPCEDQGPMIDCFGPVPDNHFGRAASEQTQAPTPLPDALSTEHSQLEVSASTCINQEQRNERQISHQQFGTQLRPPVEDQHEPLNHADTLAGNQFRNAAAAAQPVPELPPAMEQSIQDVLNDHPWPLLDSRFTHAHSQQIQDLGPSADPPSTVSSQIELPTVTCTDQMQRNERQILLQPSELQIGSPVEDQNELFNHPDPCSSTHVPAQPPSVQQSELLNHFYSRPNAQSRLPVESSVTGIGSRLSDCRTMRISPDYSSLPPQSAPVTPQVSQQIFLDPLQNELGRIRKEEEHTFKMHEEEKMRLSSECEKELEEIRRKYNTMLQNAELEFVKKKKALETNYKIVNLNRSLAEAFRLKCESRTGSSGQQQGAPPGFMQQMLRSPLQQAAQSPAPVPGPRAAPLPIPPVQMVHQPSALFSSNPIRSHFGQVRTPFGNHHIRTEMRAPAPHLQRFRPTTSMQAPSLSPLSCVLPGQRSLSNPTSASSVHPQRTPPQPTHMPGPFNRTHQSENMAAFRSSHHSSLSALELRMDVERHPSPNPPNLLPPLQDCGQIINARDAAGLKITGGLREPSVRTGTAADVVYLSDDD